MVEWVHIGKASLALGSCEDILPTLPKVDAVVTSPPYAEQRKAQYGGVAAKNYPTWAATLIARLCQKSSHVFFNIKEHVKDGQRHPYVYQTVIEAINSGVLFVDEFIWHKTNPFPTGSTTRLKDGFERIYHFSSQQAPLYPDQVAERSKSAWANDNGRRRNKGAFGPANGSSMNMGKRIVADKVRPSNVLVFPSECRSTEHPAVFPLDLPTFFIGLATLRGETILDPFMGSGTTGVAAIQMGRKFIGIEREPKYFEAACRRIREATGEDAGPLFGGGK